MDKQEEIQTKSSEKPVLEIAENETVEGQLVESESGALPACSKEYKLTRIGKIRNLVHASLTEGAKPAEQDVSLKMLQDVKMSIPVQRQGVVINVLQQAVFNTNVVNNLIGVLKVVDELEKHVTKERPAATLEDVCLKMIREGITWNEFKDMASRAYIVASIENAKSIKGAADNMGVGRTYVYKLLRRHGFMDEEIDGEEETEKERGGT